MSRIENPFVITSFESGTLSVTIVGEFRYNSWAAFFGHLQTILLSKSYNGKLISHLNLDILSLRWADPLPLISLFISLQLFKDSGGTISLIDLPEISHIRSGKIDNYYFLKFFALEGFFNLLNLLVDNPVKNEYLEIVKNYPTELYFSNPTVLTARIIDTSNIGDFDDYVESMISEIIPFTNPVINDFNSDRILSKIKHFLIESLDNIYRHAYVMENFSTIKKYAGIYIRFRKGLLDLPQDDNLRYIFQNEFSANPQLGLEFPNTNKSFLELFITDAGCGITKSLEKEIKISGASTFAHACRAAFAIGTRSSSSKMRMLSEKGGLYLINQIFADSKEYICGHDDGTWYGSLFPIDEGIPSTSDHKSDLHENHSNIKISGTSWIVRITLNEPNFLPHDKIQSWQNDFKSNPFFVSCYDDMFVDLKNFYYEDYRYFPGSVNNIAKKKIGLNVISVNEFYKSNEDLDSPYNNHSTCILLPKEAISKNGVLRIIHDFYMNIRIKDYNTENVFEDDSKTLIILDIAPNDYLSYFYALNNFACEYISPIKHSYWFTVFNEIILITRNGKIGVFTKRKIGLSKIQIFQYDSNINIADKFESFPLDIIPVWLKSLDSYIYWYYLIRSSNAIDYFIPSKVFWSDGFKLNGYLNFIQTLSDPVFLKLYRNSLERISELQSGKTSRYLSSDVLTKNLCNDFNINKFKNNISFIKILIGSVSVTGKTSSDSNIKADSIVYFFQHKSKEDPALHGKVIGSKFNTLFLWPNKLVYLRFQTRNEVFHRVDRTYAVAPGGSYFFNIPRYDSNGNSFYHRTPVQSYKDIQNISPQLLKIVHYNYNDRHELFFFNIIEYVKYSFSAQTDLALYLVAWAFFSLGGKAKKDLRPNYSHWYDKIQPFKNEFRLNVPFITYIAHYETDFIIEKIKNILTTKLCVKIIPIININNRNRISQLQINPLTLLWLDREIKKYSKNNNEKNISIFVFDSMFISGRTRKDIKHILLNKLGVPTVKTISVIDRQRLSYYLPNRINSKSYWRFDIPRLGHESECQLCKAIRIATNLKSYLHPSSMKVIDEWIKYWAFVDLSNISSFHGLESKYIQLNKPLRKFSVDNRGRQIGGTKNMIKIFTSNALNCFTTEVNSMVGKDDLVFNLCNTENLDADIQIELLATQILLFGMTNSYKLNIDIIKLLLISMNSNVSAQFSAMGALVLLLIDPELIAAALTELNLHDNRFIDEDIKNIDLLISLLAHHDFLTSKKQFFYSRGSNFLIKGTDKKSIYDSFHTQFHSKKGLRHSKALWRIINRQSNFSKIEIEESICGLEQILYCLNQMKYYEVYEDVVQVKEKINYLLNIIPKKIELLSNILKSNEQSTETEQLIFCSLKEIETNYSLIHKAFYLELKYDDLLPPACEFISIFSYIISQKCSHENIKYDNYIKFNKEIFFGKELWIYWDKVFHDELINLVKNSIKNAQTEYTYTTGYFTGDPAKVWISFEVVDEYLTITLINLSKIDAEEVLKLTTANAKLDQMYIRNFGGKIDYISDKCVEHNLYILKTIFSIPILI